MSDDKELKKKLLYEAHNTVFTMHPRGNKMYQDLKQYYWWRGMKKGCDGVCVQMYDVLVSKS